MVQGLELRVYGLQDLGFRISGAPVADLSVSLPRKPQTLRCVKIHRSDANLKCHVSSSLNSLKRVI